MGSNGRTRLEVEANGALSPVAEDLREESSRPSIGEVG